MWWRFPPRQLRWLSVGGLTSRLLPVSCTFALACGLSNTTRQPRRLDATPCGGYSAAAGRVVALLRSGTFDAWLATAPRCVIDCATARGWAPLPAAVGFLNLIYGVLKVVVGDVQISG